MRPWTRGPIAAALLLLICLTGCTPAARPPARSPGKLQIVASVYPLAWFAEQVTGNAATVQILVPSERDPHSWEPTAGTVKLVREADVLLYSDAHMEPWAPRLHETSEGKHRIAVAVNASVLADTHDEDPHLWLDPVLASGQVAVIAEALKRAAPEHAAEFADRAAEIQRRLQDIDAGYRALAQCPQQTFAITAPYFTHSATRYGLSQLAATTAAGHDTEPRPQTFARLIRDMKARNLNAIFAESERNRVAQAIVRETGATLLVLHPLESLSSADREQGLDYMAGMERNLAHLRIGLSCADKGAP